MEELNINKQLKKLLKTKHRSNIIQGSAALLSEIVGVEDEEERNNLLNRQLAITTQLMDVHGINGNIHFDDLVNSAIELTTELRTTI